MEKILVVEDEPSVAMVVRHHLQGAGYSPLSTDNVDDAWRLVGSEAPAGAIVDLKLPGADGWELIERIRRDPQVSDLPVVVLTGLLDPEVVDRVAELGCTYIGKPFAAGELLEKLDRLIRGRGAPRPPDLDADQLRIDLVPTEVTLLLRGYRIEGTVFLPPEAGRFSDRWEAILADRRDFIPVVGARVLSDPGSLVASTDHLQVRKAEVLAIVPTEKG